MRIKFLRAYHGIQPGTVTEEQNQKSLDVLLEKHVIDEKKGEFWAYAEKTTDPPSAVPAEVERLKAAKCEAAAKFLAARQPSAGVSREEYDRLRAEMEEFKRTLRAKKEV